MGGRGLTAGCSAVGGDGIAGFVVWRISEILIYSLRLPISPAFP